MDFETKIAALRPDYLRRTQRRIAHVRDTLAAAAPDALAAALMEARLVLHDIAGTAPVMGLAEAGSAARAAEDHVLALLASQAPQDGRVELLAAFDTLHRSVMEPDVS